MKIMAMTLLAALLCSCQHGQTLKPHSGGRPYEVVVISKDNDLRHVIDSLMTMDVAGLPQSEPMFNLSHPATQRLTQATRYARNIIIVEKDSTRKRASLTFSRNCYAMPQLIVKVKTPSTEQLKDVSWRLTALIEHSELEALTASLNGHRNTESEQRIEEMFGWQIVVPQELTFSKWGHDFVWLSDNGNSTMSNLCLYTYSASNLDVATLVNKRDSIMGVNIPGETAIMRMKTDRQTPLAVKRDKRGQTCRGLWIMENDAMGGPFVCRMALDSSHGKVIVAEGFVYAPGRKKRDMLKRLEAAASTMKKKIKDKKYNNGR